MERCPPRDREERLTATLPEIPEIEPEAAAASLADGAVILDVREPDEWDAGHIAGALHIPLRELALREGELPRDRRLIAVCRSGSRSAHVTAALRRAGYDIENLAGGMKAWVQAGLPIEPVEGFVA